MTEDPTTEEPSRSVTAPAVQVRPLKLSFEELSDPGLSTRGAQQIGAQELGSDEFLVGMKRRDYEDAMERAKRDLAAAPALPPDIGRITEGKKTPIYLLLGGFLVFVGILVAGGLAVKTYFEREDAARLRAIQGVLPKH
jgi:hypothetical protein